jgi:hypothetical protein
VAHNYELDDRRWRSAGWLYSTAQPLIPVGKQISAKKRPCSTRAIAYLTGAHTSRCPQDEIAVLKTPLSSDGIALFCLQGRGGPMPFPLPTDVFAACKSAPRSCLNGAVSIWKAWHDLLLRDAAAPLRITCTPKGSPGARHYASAQPPELLPETPIHAPIRV